MSLEQQVARVLQGTKDTLKTLINKMGGEVGDELIDLYPDLAEALEFRPGSVVEQNKGLEQKFWRGSTSEYEALEEKDENTMYIITDENESAVEDALIVVVESGLVEPVVDENGAVFTDSDGNIYSL